MAESRYERKSDVRERVSGSPWDSTRAIPSLHLASKVGCSSSRGESAPCPPRQHSLAA